MRRLWLLTLLCLGSCGDADGPQNGVDTTLPTQPGKIIGSLTAPGDYLPADIRVCVETAAGKPVSCQAKIENSGYSGSYEIEVPEGDYRVYATTSEVPNFKAYYTQCSPEPGCPSRTPAVVKVEEGESTSNVDPSWIDRPTATTQTSEDSYEGTSGYTDTNAVDVNETEAAPTGEPDE